MRTTRLIAVLVGLAAIAMVTTEASAMYHAGMGRFMQRDPGAGAGGPARMGSGGAPAASGRFIPRDPTGSNQYADGMNLYQYVQGGPTSYVDPSGLEATVPCAVSPCQVKQISGPDGDGSMGYGAKAVRGYSPRRRNIWRYSHTIKTPGPNGKTVEHKVGHTWLSCGDRSYGFYPKDYKKGLWTGDRTSRIPGIYEGDEILKNPKPSDPLEGRDFSGQQIQPDWIWKTEVDTADTRTFKDSQGADKPCKCASCDDIKACVDRQARRWGGTDWTLSRHCQDFTISILSKCCLSAKDPPTMTHARQKVKWWHGGGDAGRHYTEQE